MTTLPGIVAFITPEYLEARLNGSVGQLGQPGQLWTETENGPVWADPPVVDPGPPTGGVNMFTNVATFSGTEGTLSLPGEDVVEGTQIRLGYVLISAQIGAS